MCYMNDPSLSLIDVHYVKCDICCVLSIVGYTVYNINNHSFGITYITRNICGVLFVVGYTVYNKKNHNIGITYITHVTFVVLSVIGYTVNAAMAAALGGTVGVIGQLNDPQYLNWIKATRAMHNTMEALRTFCQARMNGLHQLLLLKHGATQCSGPCSCGNIRYIRNTNNYVINCPNNVCSQWLADIVAERATPTTRLKFGNCDISQWPVQPWQIAKVFMDRQDPSTVSPNDTDASGILQLLKNCKYFTPFLDTRKADAVRLYIY